MTDTNLLDAGASEDPQWPEARRLLEAREFKAAIQLVQAQGADALAPSLNVAGVAATVLQARPLAESFFRRAMALDPGFSHSYNNLALFLRVDGRLGEAEQVFHAGLQANPGAGFMRMALANFLWLQERHAEAEAQFRELVRRDPGDAEARFKLGGLLLSLGRFEEGWPYYEARYDPSRKDAPEPIRFGFPQWRGEPLEGRSILVWFEQGYGDEIQFCRYVPLLKAQGAAQVTVVCKPPLEPLLGSLAGLDRLAPAAGVQEIEDHDCWTYLMSIPYRLGTRLETVPAQVPYLSVTAERRARWAARIPPAGLRVGLVWKGNPDLANDKNRSLPGLEALRPLWDVPGVTFVSMQKGADEAAAANPPADQPLVDLGAAAEDFADTAAMMDGLDLVISVDTASAHLAGALGKPCFCLIPAEGMDWRWMVGRSDSPWYPSLRLFRRRRGESWDPVVQEVAAALAEVAAAHAARQPTGAVAF